MEIIIQILTVIGSLGLFLFGMRMMSDSLQKVAGNRLRNTLATITSNRIKGITTGFAVTGAIQSSSATTVMLVSFANAGLISLTESVGVIMGANIGTTITAWLITFFGFNVNLYVLLLPILAISMPFSYSAKSRLRSWGEFMVGFALLFLGLDFLKESMPPVAYDSDIVRFITDYANQGWSSVLLFLGLGFVLTIIFQSSSAMMALTFVLCSKGWISYEMATAMVLGENLGTTITANLAALVANEPGKRTALAHFFFNLLGLVWALLIFRNFAAFIDSMVVGLGNESAYLSVSSIPLALSIYHTAFNILNTLIFLVFARQLIRIVLFVLPEKEEEEHFRLKYIGTTFMTTSELSLVQARKEIHVFAERIRIMFGFIPRLLLEKGPRKYARLLDRIMKYEEIADNMEIEIANYLTRISESDLSKEGTRRLRNMLKVIDYIESIGDICKTMAELIDTKNRNNIWFNQKMRNNLAIMFNHTDKSLELMSLHLSGDASEIDRDKMHSLQKDIRGLREKLQEENREDVKRGEYAYQNGSYYSDLIVHCEEISIVIMKVVNTDPH